MKKTAIIFIISSLFFALSSCTRDETNTSSKTATEATDSVETSDSPSKDKHVHVENYNLDADRVYTGYLLDSLPDGEGELRIKSSNCLYRGKFSKGLYQGNGRFEWKGKGDYFEGEFRNNEPYYGQFVYANTMHYKGGMKNWLFEGRGTFDWNTYNPDGSVNSYGWLYEGNFSRGTISGQTGRITFTVAREGKEGEGIYWFEGVMDGFPSIKKGQQGRGKIRYGDGTIYEGSLKYRMDGSYIRYGAGKMDFKEKIPARLIGIPDDSYLCHYVGSFDETQSGWMYGSGCFYTSVNGSPQGYLPGFWKGLARLGEYQDSKGGWKDENCLAAWKDKDAYFFKQEKDLYRPLIHMTCDNAWMNDPNGLWYDQLAKTYHAYYQFSYEVEGGVRYWGHKKSQDMLHWKEEPIALYPGSDWDVWSGSVVIDEENRSGIFSDAVPKEQRVLAFYTIHTNEYEIGDPVGVSYSLDGGYSFISRGIAIENRDCRYGRDFRDPKVFWNAEYGEFVMIIGGYEPIRLFTSHNLIDWEYNATLSLGFEFENGSNNRECMDTFPLKVAGTSEEKWVLSLSLARVYVGTFKKSDGVYSFVSETSRLHNVIYPGVEPGGYRFYAGQTFAGIEDRTIGMGWLMDFTGKRISSKNWNGVESLPLEISLHRKGLSYAIGMKPAMKDEAIDKSLILEHNAIDIDSSSLNLFEGLHAKHFDLKMELDLSSCDEFSIDFRKGNKEHTSLIYRKSSQEIILDARNSGLLYDYVLYFRPTLESNILNLRLLLDNSVISCFGEKGMETIYAAILPKENSDEMKLEAKGRLGIRKLSLHSLKN